MPNTLLTIEDITRESLYVLENNLTFTSRVSRQYDDKFGRDGAKIGSVLNVRKPPRYLGRDGQALTLEDSVETQVPVVLEHQSGVDIQFSSQDLALSIDDFSDRFLKPAVANVANKIDHRGMALYKQVYQSVGTPGTVPNALLTYLQAQAKLNDSATPMDGQRCVVISSTMEITIVDALKGLFQQASEISSQYRRGQMGTVAGFDWYMDQNANTHTVGPLGGTPAVNGASQTGTSLITDGWTAAAANRVLEGDVFTIANVNHVNPQNRESTGALQQFVVTADGDSDGAGDLTLTIDPPMVASGAEQTIDALPANNALLTFVGAAGTQTPQGLAFHRDAFVLASADLPLPGGVDMADRLSDDQVGLSIRLVRAYDINTDNYPCRLDVLYGWAVLRAELACRVQS